MSFVCFQIGIVGYSFCRSFSLLVQRKRNKRKDPFAEEFFAVGKNRSKTPRRYAPVFGAFQRIFCTSGFRAAHGIKYKSIVMLLLVFFYQDAKIQAQSED